MQTGCSRLTVAGCTGYKDYSIVHNFYEHTTNVQ